MSDRRRILKAVGSTFRLVMHQLRFLIARAWSKSDACVDVVQAYNVAHANACGVGTQGGHSPGFPPALALHCRTLAMLCDPGRSTPTLSPRCCAVGARRLRCQRFAMLTTLVAPSDWRCVRFARRASERLRAPRFWFARDRDSGTHPVTTTSIAPPSHACNVACLPCHHITSIPRSRSA